MKNQATRLDLIERQRKRQAETLGWIILCPMCVTILAAIITWPVWGGV